MISRSTDPVLLSDSTGLNRSRSRYLYQTSHLDLPVGLRSEVEAYRLSSLSPERNYLSAPTPLYDLSATDA